MSAAPVSRPKTFISYSHQNAPYLMEMQKHLAYFEHNGLLDMWVDTKIKPDQRWFDEIRQGLASVRTTVFLVSANFLASEGCGSGAAALSSGYQGHLVERLLEAEPAYAQVQRFARLQFALLEAQQAEEVLRRRGTLS